MIKHISIAFFLVISACSIHGQSFNMTLESNWDNTSYTYNDCWGYTDALGNEYAILGSRERVLFIDVTTPSAPSVIAEFTGSFPGIPAANSIWRDFKTYDRYAYAVADQGSEGMMVFDMSDIHNGNVVKVNQLNTHFTRAHNIFIDVPEGKLYALGPNTPGTPNDDVVVYDIKDDPSNPVFLASVNVSGGYIHDAYVENNILYASSGNDGLYIIDMSTPTSPSFMSFETSIAAGFNHSGWPFDNGDKMIVAEEVPQGLKLGIFDISDLSAISFLNDFRDPINTSGTGNVTYHNPYMVGDLAVISSYEDGITIMDLSDSNNPFRAAHYDTWTNTNYAGYEGCWGAYPYFPSGTIIGSDIATGMYVLSTSLSLTNTCSNGVQDDFEIDVDCGGFCNTCVCSAPTDMVFTDITSTNIEINWTAVSTAVGYELRYKLSSSNTWTNITTSTNSITINNLVADTDYDFQIRADCGNRLTPYATSVTHTTGVCPPTGLYSGVQDGTFTTSQFIQSIATIPPSNDVSYFTGDSILLGNDFLVDLNADFLAEINAPCGVAAFTGQSQIAQFASIEPAPPEQKYTIVENREEGVFYVISNSNSRKPYKLEIIDDKGELIATNPEPQLQTLVKMKSMHRKAKLVIREGDQIFEYELHHRH